MGRALLGLLVLAIVIAVVWGCGYQMGASSQDDYYGATVVITNGR
ncbi:MAG: hypothetical protein ACI38U_02180 [Corynebacterium sp.]